MTDKNGIYIVLVLRLGFVADEGDRKVKGFRG